MLLILMDESMSDIAVYKHNLHVLQELIQVQTPSEDAVAHQFSSLLFIRDRIEHGLQNQDKRLYSELAEIHYLDDLFYKVGHEAITSAPDKINMADWRRIRTQDVKTLPWWWCLDRVTGPGGVYYNDYRLGCTIFWIIVSALIIFLFLDIIFDTTQRVADFLVHLVVNVPMSDLGFDLLAIVGIGIQFILGIGLAYGLSQRFAVGITSFLASSCLRVISNLLPDAILPGLRKKACYFLQHDFFVGEIFVGVLFFVIIVGLSNWRLMPYLGDQLREQSLSAIEAEVQERNLQFASLLNPSPEQDNSPLTLVGLRYEYQGDLEQAKSIYVRTFSNQPLARYRLAEMYIEEGKSAQALRLLDEGLDQIARQRSGTDQVPGLEEGDNNELTQIEFLYEVSRAKAMLKAGNVRAALDILEHINRDLVEPDEAGGSTLFYSIPVARSGPDRDWQAVRAIEMYYLTAQANDLMFAQTQKPEYEAQANANWDKVILLAERRDSQHIIWRAEANNRRGN